MSVFELELERLTQDLARRVRQTMRAEAIAFAMADEGSTRLRVAHAVGYDGERDALEERVRSHGLEALAAGRVLMHRTPRGQELTAPMLAPSGLVGVMVVLAEDVDSSAILARAERELAAIADDGAMGIEHARQLGRLQHREELEAAATIATGIANELRNPPVRPLLGGTAPSLPRTRGSRARAQHRPHPARGRTPERHGHRSSGVWQRPCGAPRARRSRSRLG